MPDRFDVEIDGGARLNATLDDAAARFRDLTEFNAAAGAVVVARSAGAAPRVTGQLAASVRVSADRTAARIGSDVPYAAAVHWGVPSRNQTAQPWLSEAAVHSEAAWVDVYAKGAAEILSTVKGA